MGIFYTPSCLLKANMLHQEDWTIVTSQKKKPQYIEIVNKKTNPNGQSETQETHPLQDTWVYWMHDLNDERWTLESYRQLLTFNTVEDFWIVYNNVTNMNNGMYYLMRQRCPPIWDHAINVNGGGWTFKVDKKYAHDFWEKLSCFCVGEMASNQPGNVIGVSISPKVKFVTIRLWTQSSVKNSQEFDAIKRATENDSVVINFENARFTPNKQANC